MAVVYFIKNEFDGICTSLENKLNFHSKMKGASIFAGYDSYFDALGVYVAKTSSNCI